MLRSSGVPGSAGRLRTVPAWLFGLFTLAAAASRPAAALAQQPGPATRPTTRVSAQPPEPGLNVLLISIDTLRADHLGCYGHPTIRTPNIDGLAAEGVLFATCVSPVPITLPSHSSMLTGTYPCVHGARDNGRFHLHPDNPTLTEQLKAAGYVTAAEVAAYVLNREFGLSQGFDIYHDIYTARQRQEDPSKAGATERYAADVCDSAISLLRELAGRRFFLFVHFFDPHQPYQPPAHLAEAYVHPYLGEIAYVDEQIGRLLAALESLRLDDETLVVLTSDHGEGLGQHNEATHTMFVYDSTLLVPLIMRCPGRLPAGRRVTAQVRLIDIAPTVLDLLGLEPLPGAQGRSVLPLVTGTAEPPRWACAESLAPLLNLGYAPLRALRGDGWKYIHAPRPELYHVADDPGELRNLAAAEPQRLAQMRAQLYALVESASAVAGPATATRQLSPEEARRLRELGYLTGGAGAGTLAGMSERELLDVSGEDPKDHAEEIKLLAHAGALEAAGDLAGAEAVLRRLLASAAERGQECWAGHFTLGKVLIEQGKREEAVRHLQAAVRIRPDDGEALTLLGEALAALGRRAEALETLERASRCEPVSPRTHRSYAKTLRDAGRTHEAMHHYRLALEKDPGFRAAALAQGGVDRLHATAIAFLKQRDYATAAETLRAALVLAPQDLELANNLAWILATSSEQQVRDPAEAVRLAERVRDAAAKPDPNWLDTLAAAYAAAGRFDEAVATIDQAVELARRGGQQELATQFLARRELYVSKRPFIER